MIKASKLHKATFTSCSLLKLNITFYMLHFYLEWAFFFFFFYWGPLYGVGERGWSLWGWKMEAHGSSWVLGFSNGLVTSTLFPYLFMFSLFRISILTHSRKAQPPPRTITTWPFHILGYSGLLFTWDYLTAISYFKFPFKESVWIKLHFRWPKNVHTVIDMFVTMYVYL